MGAVGTTLAGRYRLERMLAEGGMGEVWLARHLSLDVPVAVKLMGGDATIKSNVRSRFELEAKAIAQLRCPNIVQIIDFGTENDVPFIVMELLEGADLLSLIPKRRLWPLVEIADIVTQVGKGLTAAHARGIIHRDIKPGNIFLSRSGNDTIIKLLDFGIAKWIASEQNLTETDAVLGSPFYMSPEQVRGEVLDNRADVWSLSVVAYRLATGTLPFEGRDAIEVAERVMIGKWRAVPPSTPKAAELQKLFERALAERREDRFPNAQALTDAFAAVAGGVKAAWTGPAPSAAGENTVTIVRPRISQPDDASVTEISQSLLLSEDSEPEVSTLPNDRDPRVPRPAFAASPRSNDETLTNPLQSSQIPSPAQSSPLQSYGLVPPPPRSSSPGVIIGMGAGMNGQHGPMSASMSATSTPAPWLETQKMDASDFLTTGKIDVPTLRQSVYLPDVPPSRSPTPAVFISLGLCGALVAGIAVWIAVNVGLSSKSSASVGDPAESAERVVAPPPTIPPPPAVTSAPAVSATATASASPKVTPPKTPVAPPRPPTKSGGKGQKAPSWMKH